MMEENQKSEDDITATTILDVGTFFSELIDSYSDFENSVYRVTSEVDNYSPQTIAKACSVLTKKREQLVLKDEQVLDMLELAGSEMASTNLLHDYRIVMARANLACNNLYQKLQAVKAVYKQQPINLEVS